MATTNLSTYNKKGMPDENIVRHLPFCVIVSDWNSNITSKLLDGALRCLKENGADEDCIDVIHVPGSFELIYAAAKAMTHSYAAIIVLGSVVRGGTPHFDYVCSGVTQGIAQLNAQGKIPVIFGLLTTDDMQQALDRADGVLGNKGVEAAQTALKMVSI